MSLISRLTIGKQIRVRFATSTLSLSTVCTPKFKHEHCQLAETLHTRIQPRSKVSLVYVESAKRFRVIQLELSSKCHKCTQDNEYRQLLSFTNEKSAFQERQKKNRRRKYTRFVFSSHGLRYIRVLFFSCETHLLLYSTCVAHA